MKQKHVRPFLIRLDPYISVGVPVSHKWAIPVPHYERLSAILEGMSFEDAKAKYPEIGRLPTDLAAEKREGEERGAGRTATDLD